jgi:hypothetical protein
MKSFYQHKEEKRGTKDIFRIAKNAHEDLRISPSVPEELN